MADMGAVGTTTSRSEASCTGTNWGSKKTCEEIEVLCELDVAADWLQGEVYSRKD
jgi:hypothetical protein